MSTVWNPSTASVGELNDTQATGRALAPVLTAAAVLFNFVLCFVNTNLLHVDGNVVILVEIALIGLAFGLIWHCSTWLYAILLPMTIYFMAVMVVRSEFDPKILRDLLIPIVFFFVGRYLGSCRTADRLVTLLISIAFGVALFEWWTPGTFLHYFDVMQYYIARGTVMEVRGDIADGFFNSTRFDERTLLPFLGEHRVSGIFLEAPSVGTFGAIAFAWVLLRDRQHLWSLIAKSVAIVTIILLADARFGLYFCIFTLALFFARPTLRPGVLFIAPFLAMIALATYAEVNWQEAWTNTISGRFLLAGQILADLDPWQVIGLQASDIKTGLRFAADPVTDSGYAYMLIKVGIVGVAAMWALFVYAPVRDTDATRFKYFAAFYFIILLTISASVFTIKTAALLWFLYGTLSRADIEKPSESALQNLM